LDDERFLGVGAVGAELFLEVAAFGLGLEYAALLSREE
jgi:hypothetical protein